MKNDRIMLVLGITGLLLAGCGQRQAPADETAVAPAGGDSPVPAYSAEAFFETTSYGLVGPSAHAFSSDGKSLLISSDATGVFNAYALPLDGNEPRPLTTSDDNAVFAVSWFPRDDRILYTYDGGGNELNHIVVREVDGSSRDLTPGDALKAGFVNWSDDGNSFVHGDGQPIRTHPANIKPVGSGPYKLVELKPGESFVMERFDNFLRPGKPYIDRVIGVLLRDPNASEVAFKNQEMHRAGFNSTLRLKALSRLAEMEQITLTKEGYEAIAPICYLEFNLRKAPFSDVRVRKAIAYAIDTNFITQKLHYGLTTPATGPIHFSSPFYTDDVVKYDLDLEKANRLLDEAGYPKKDDGMRFSATLDWLPGVYDDQEVVAEYLKPQLKKIGIDLNLRKPSDFGSWIKQVAGWNYEMSLNVIFCYPDPVIGVHRLYLSDNIKHVPWSNTQGYSNPVVDDLLAKAAVEMDFNKRKALYAEFQKIITDDVPMAFIHSPAYHTISNSQLRDEKKSVWGVMAPGDGIYWKDGKAPK